MKLLNNPLRGKGMPALTANAQSLVSNDVASVMKLLQACPAAKPTPLVTASDLAHDLGIGGLYIKDERPRMGLGSFKALGAAYAIAKAAVAANSGEIGSAEDMATALNGAVYVTASAGNHGMSVAAGARIFGARAVVYLSKTVPAGFADKLRSFGAEVVIEGDDYEASMAGAQAAADKNGWRLLSDSTWEGYDGGRDIMEGYLAMPAEADDEMDTPPTHIFLQAGVGGLAAAVAVYARNHWGDGPVICVVEPSAAPALMASVEAGKPVHAAGPVSNMGRLDCKEPSFLALEYLAREANAFMTLDDDYVAQTITRLNPEGIETSPSGGAGFAGLVAAVDAGALGLGSDSRVLIFISEGPADD